MNTVDIKRGDDIVVSVHPDDSSVQYKKVMAENEIRLQFILSYAANFQVGDYADVYGERYKINKQPVAEKDSTYSYRYTLNMQASYFDLTKVQYFFLGDDNTLKQPDFSLMGNGDTFIDLLISNLTRVGQVWEKGQVIPTVYKNITFSAVNCYDALAAIAGAFDTEFWVEGSTIHLTKRSTYTGQLFRHGRNKGLREIIQQQADDAVMVTRIYPFGSSKNIPSDYRNYSNRLLLPSPDVYLEKNVELYGVIEATQIFEDIYPHRTGTVSAVNAVDPFTFKDGSIDFNVNDQLLPGTSAKITFNTGGLSGYTFEISSFNNATKEFRILLNKNETAYDDGVPNASIKMAIGDEYVITDISMPQSYIDAAEAELKVKAQQILYAFSVPVSTYRIIFDPTYLRKKKILPEIGQVIWLRDSPLQVDKAIRIISSTRNIINEYNIDVELSQVVSQNIIEKLSSSVSSNASGLSDLSQKVNTDSLINNGTAIGDLKIKQGTVIINNMSTPPPGADLRQVYIDLNSKKLYYQ